MAKSTNYSSERRLFEDPRSGLHITQLSHYSCIGTSLYFEMCSFTEDESHVVFVSQRGAGRGAPWDLYRVQIDGLNLTQLTERDDLSGIVFSPARSCAYYQSAEQVWRLDVLSLEETAIADAPGQGPVQPYSLATIDALGKHYYANCPMPDGGQAIFRVDVDSGAVQVLYQSAGQNHLHVDPADKTLHFNDFTGGAGKAHLIDTDGTNVRASGFEQFAHHTWFGETGKMQGTLLPPGRAIALRGEDDVDFTILAEGPYFWHSSPSADTQWIVSDTNWPQEGILLLHVPTGRVSYVCDPKSSCCHPQWTHPHPALSPRMEYVLFNSDMTGIGQVYLAKLTPEFLTKAQAC